MKKTERRMILILIIISIIIIAILVKVTNKKVTEGENANQPMENEQGQIEEFVEVLEDGTKVNTSSKLSETKTFAHYEISNTKITQKEGQSYLVADVKNIGETKLDVALVDITLFDKEGNEITTIGGIIGDTEPGQVVPLTPSATTDFANAYDFTIKVLEQ